MDAPLWRRYALALESRGMLDEARDARMRASGHFLRRRCDVVLEHATFEETFFASAKVKSGALRYGWSSSTVSSVSVPPQTVVSVAVTVVPAAGAST